MTTERIYDERNRLIGRVTYEADDRTYYYNANGIIVARVIGGITYDRTGNVRGRGDQGMRLLSEDS